jgi:tyrosinase
MKKKGLSRRSFLKTAVASSVFAATAARGGVFGSTPARTAKYIRYNAMSAGGQKALASYAKAIDAMLKLPPDHPHNWFRNAFVHLMDCPHGNWWFYVWHRGFLGYFEQVIRKYSGDPTFAFPYWDWTELPQIPDQMFNGPLTPNDEAYEPYTQNLDIFTQRIRPALEAYWKTLSGDQVAQLNIRGYTSLDVMWNDVIGFDANLEGGTSGNRAFSPWCGARYLTLDNPKLDPKTAYDVSPFVVLSGLEPVDFYNSNLEQSFNSLKTTSHNAMPARGVFCTLEGMPHNKTHNYIGGVGPIDPGPYGNMTNNLSPVDPIFFLHHSNMDRLWDVWTRKQKSLGFPFLPTGNDLVNYSREPFLFFVDVDGKYITDGKAGDYIDMNRWDYEYEPGFGEALVGAGPGVAKKPFPVPPLKGAVTKNSATLAVSKAAIANHLNEKVGTSLIAEVTVTRPDERSALREFDVIIGAPPGVTEVGADSPYYAGTIAFFGKMASMEGMSREATFAVPVPKRPETFRGTEGVANPTISIRIVPSQKSVKAAAMLRSVTLKSR